MDAPCPESGPSTSLRAEDYPTAPFVDARPALADRRPLRETARELGYLYLPGLIEATLLARVRAYVRGVAERHGWIEPAPPDSPSFAGVPGAQLTGHGWDDPNWISLQTSMRDEASYRELAESTAIAEVLTELFGEPALLATANHCWLKLPGSPGQTTRPHQDRYYLPKSPELWTAWVAVVDTPMELGPLGVVAGSHRTGLWHHTSPWVGIEVPRETTWATGPARAGDVVLFDSLTVHCAWSNLSPTHVRCSFDLRYEPRSVVEQRRSVLRPVL